MITNNVKTTLFASLIVAMILPFGGMDFAMAEETVSTETIRADAQAIAANILRVQEEIASAKAELEDSADDRQVSELESRLAKLEARLAKLEQNLTEKVNDLSQATSSAAEAPTEEKAARSIGGSSANRSIGSNSGSSTCYGLINEANECDSDMNVKGTTVSLIQPLEDYATGSCPSGSPTTTCANFVYAAYDIPGWYYEGNDIYFYGSGFTNTCTLDNTCSTWGVIARLPLGDSADIDMTDAPTGIPMRTSWFMYYEGLIFGATQPHIHVQNLADGYDPNP